LISFQSVERDSIFPGQNAGEDANYARFSGSRLTQKILPTRTKTQIFRRYIF